MRLPYPLLRPLLFRLEAERAHDLSLAALGGMRRLGLSRAAPPAPPALPVTVMGLHFANPVGLAAGLDKNASHVDALAGLGFGFLEVGTVTPRPQPGNPRPRLFRLPKSRALINRMGFNNVGADVFLRNLERSRYRGVLGVNIGKNADTPLARAADDYLECLRLVYARADYITVNVSSPNTQGLRALQEGEELSALLATLKAEQAVLADQHGKYVPLALKIAPDLDDAQVDLLAATARRQRVDALIATNTTIARPGVAGQRHADQDGGLSGAPLLTPANAVLARLHASLADEIPLIGVGGILQGRDAVAKIAAGASLVQLYTGLIYRGPKLVRECVTALARDAGVRAKRSAAPR